MNDRQERFIKLLENIFELDKSDLDFGIYRIMNIRRAEIEKFFKEGLPKKINETLAPFAGADSATIRKRMADIETSLGGVEVIAQMPAAVPMVAEYNDLKKKLAEGVDISALESDVYSALYSFFSRYYDDGDFISKRRYKEGVYAIPYEGEEVKLYWANQDQYYIKTSENFKDYTFKTNEADGITVHFRLVDATTEQNNNKEADDKKRTFMLYTETAENPELKTFEYDAEKRELIIRFVYDIPANTKTKWHEVNMKAINAWIAEHPELIGELLRNVSTKSGEFLPIIEKHLKGYVAKNTFDYFIHKDLGGFLRRELDFFIKNEVMHIDDIDTETETRVEAYLGKVRAIKRVGGVIIDFLAQVEDFQKRLWLKKKFVVETNYCITLDKIDERFYEEIAANEAQVKEWIEMYAIDEIKADMHTLGFSLPLSVEFLKQNQNLVVDTRHFDAIFRDKLIATIDNFDEQCDGLLINSENFQALNLLQQKYNKKIDSIYIDPPFNLGENADYLYRVDYKNSTWCQLLADRIELTRNLYTDNGYIFVRCSHDGNMLVRLLLEQLMGSNNYRNEIILRRAEESKGDLNKQFGNIKSITVNYDNLYWFSHLPSSRFNKILKPISSEKGKAHWHSFWKAEDRPNMRYEILGIDLNTHYGQWMWERNRAQRAVDNYIEYTTNHSHKTLEEYWNETGRCLEFIKRDGATISSIKYWIPPREYTMADNNWLDIKGYANKWGFKTENSEGTLYRIINSLTDDNSICLDFFGGSGTTMAVAHKLRRKWIGVEMGEQFYSVIIPRLKMVLNGEKSGVSDIVKWNGGGCFKYMRLESYEDALSNIELKKAGGISLWGEDYLINYMLNMESRDSLLSIDKFRSPFEYKMRITEKNECRERQVDVCETFNYLIGLKVMSQSTTTYYSAEKSASPAYDGAVELRKDDGGLYGFRQIEGVLPDGRRALVIWRTITDNILASNAALDAYFSKYRINPAEREYDIIYVNGDNNLENLRTDDEQWKVVMIEKEFNEKMWEE